MFFAVGIVIGTMLQGAMAQSPRATAVNHVAIAVPNFEEARKFYTETMGFREAFSFRDDNGQPALTYLQVSRETFIEIQPVTPQRPAGITHIGLEVPSMEAFIARLKTRGVSTEEPRAGRTGTLLSNITAPGNARFELVEMRPGSAPLKAIESWKP
jgi:catechol 2,3-dioxygenase-like lactoylglutathione lyase family enzyme